MEITIDRNYTFIPEWNENKDDPNPVQFQMRRLSTGERDKLIGYQFNAQGELSIAPDRQKLFLAGVVKIENLKVNGRFVTSGKDFLEEPGFDILMAEVVANVMAQNARDNLKNF